jgi:hypothetical protein
MVLVMLVVITLFGIAGIRMSTSSLTVVGNMQARKFTENYARLAIEQIMNSIQPFNNATTAIVTSATASGVGSLHRLRRAGGRGDQRDQPRLPVLGARHRLQRHLLDRAGGQHLGIRRHRRRQLHRRLDQDDPGREDPPAERLLHVTRMRGMKP